MYTLKFPISLISTCIYSYTPFHSYQNKIIYVHTINPNTPILLSVYLKISYTPFSYMHYIEMQNYTYTNSYYPQLLSYMYDSKSPIPLTFHMCIHINYQSPFILYVLIIKLPIWYYTRPHKTYQIHPLFILYCPSTLYMISHNSLNTIPKPYMI